MHIRLAGGLALLMFGVAPAFAGPVSGFYAGIYGGVAAPGPTDFDLDLYLVQLSGDSGNTDIGDINQIDGSGVEPGFLAVLNDVLAGYPQAEDGYGINVNLGGVFGLLTAPHVGAVAGYGFGNGLRVEADLSSSDFAVGNFSIGSGFFQLVSGDLAGDDWTWTVEDEGEVTGDLVTSMPLGDVSLGYTNSVQFALAGLYYDFATGTALTPYLGGGVGMARVTGTLSDGCTCGDDLTDSAIVPAAQLGAGVRMALLDPVTLDIGYRLRVAGDPGLRIESGESDNGTAALISVQQSGPIIIHAVQIGLTVALQ